MRVLCIFDVANLYFGAKFALDGKINVPKLHEMMRGQNEVYRSLAYGSYFRDEANGFINFLQNLGIEPIFTQVKAYRNGDRKANCDVQIAIDAVRLRSHYDCLALASSDGDFVPLVQYLQSEGIKIHVFGINISRDLREVANSWIELDKSFIIEEVANDTNALPNA